VADDPAAVNTARQPGAVAPCESSVPLVDNGRLTLDLPALSWHCVRLTAV